MQAEFSDQELVQLLRRDSQRAVEVLFRQHYTYLCRTAYRLLPDENLAEDLVQEVFYELWKRHAQLAITTSFKAYLRRATVNKTLNYLRDNRKLSFEGEETAVLPDPDPGIAQTLEAAELQEKIDEAVDQLPERCRIIFILSRFEEMSYQEIADLLNISPRTVENQISRALRLLREALGPYLPMALLMMLWQLGW